ncbi:MAG: aryl-sulfate sulfotransferase, partial [Bacteroidota bacterium]
RAIHSWNSDHPLVGHPTLRTDGLLLRMVKTSDNNGFFEVEGAANQIELVDQNGDINWFFEFADETKRMHHEAHSLPNGNIIFLAYELKTETEAIENGRDPSTISESALWSESIIEVNPSNAVGSEIVWEWHFWDHLHQDFDDSKSGFSDRINRDPLLLDINFQLNNGEANWVNFTGLSHFPMMDQIVMSSQHLGEFYFIDHSTTTSQAASHVGGTSNRGGDLLYRWGNPASYRQGDASDRKLFNQSDVDWIPLGLADEGKILFFNQGDSTLGVYSSIQIITPPVDDYIFGNYIFIPGSTYFPNNPDWIYQAAEANEFYSDFGSSAQRLTNGNFLITEGASGKIFEITQDRAEVWEYINPITSNGPLNQGDAVPFVDGISANRLYKAKRYNEDFAGLSSFELTAGDPLELNFPLPYECQIISSVQNPTFV